MADQWTKLRKAAVEMPIEFERYARLRYPTFVASPWAQPLRAEVPVFMYHSVEQAEFAAQMAFLSRNGYQTLTVDQFFEFLSGRCSLSAPSVLLTFDDGEKSLYHVAYPILKQYGFRAVVFAVPAYIRSEPDCAPGKGWLSWGELAEMEASGVIEVQSHSYSHSRIFNTSELVDFYHPEFDPNPLGMDVPWIELDGKLTNRLEWGTPIYRFAPNLAGHRRYIDPLSPRQACVQFVEQNGGPEFFRRDDWRKKLRQVFQAFFPDWQPVQYESEKALIQRMQDDLSLARSVLEERLDHPVRHFCFPWGAGSHTSVKFCQELGYLSAFWVVSGHRRTNKPGDDPYTIQRIKDDYLWRLPGEGRRSLLEIYQAKLRRREQTLDIY